MGEGVNCTGWDYVQAVGDSAGKWQLLCERLATPVKFFTIWHSIRYRHALFSSKQRQEVGERWDVLLWGIRVLGALHVGRYLSKWHRTQTAGRGRRCEGGGDMEEPEAYWQDRSRVVTATSLNSVSCMSYPCSIWTSSALNVNAASPSQGLHTTHSLCGTQPMPSVTLCPATLALPTPTMLFVTKTERKFCATLENLFKIIIGRSSLGVMTHTLALLDVRIP